MSETPKSSPSAVVHVQVSASDAGQRLDNFLLRHLKGVPRTRVYRLLRKGEVRVNKGRAKPDYRVVTGDMVRIPPVSRSEPRQDDRPLPQGLADLLDRSVLLEDDDLLVINKPAGLPVHGGSGVAVGVIEALRKMGRGEPFLELAHRLDRETSGCLVLARNRPALLAFHELLRSGGIDKTYLALLTGQWSGGERRVNAGLARNVRRGGIRLVQVDDEDGRDADSLFIPGRRFTEATLMDVRIGTGRTHQIRVHAAHEGHPVAGDRHYGDFEFNRRMKKSGLRRQFLHARALNFTLPVSGRTYAIEAPLEPELSQVLAQLTPLD
ncbi:RluA family pseudouridine synthase [Ectothiorhodospira lacustris]|uniref:RluA family pseudouridine synthase n=1 Tax=Ectothiorhodospira lacustris TaxID=2899127 RepID=UPI001EE8706D|nr:RluA family pseudouridine synthase [Ectothiorhodospira lacustris]MCG5499497.1 RluA family pseudouridine synthase [Ectothiorhodospira lacustris]MCG5511075.1 RluA family pseudouridine synthase [Ectothiorhodospira lacustris]MCG5522917.1 RluA family pseudouridine synthase [Ectothiorhodospira lacustris]